MELLIMLDFFSSAFLWSFLFKFLRFRMFAQIESIRIVRKPPCGNKEANDWYCEKRATVVCACVLRLQNTRAAMCACVRVYGLCCSCGWEKNGIEETVEKLFKVKNMCNNNELIKASVRLVGSNSSSSYCSTCHLFVCCIVFLCVYF